MYIIYKNKVRDCTEPWMKSSTPTFIMVNNHIKIITEFVWDLLFLIILCYYVWRYVHMQGATSIETLIYVHISTTGESGLRGSVVPGPSPRGYTK